MDDDRDIPLWLSGWAAMALVIGVLLLAGTVLGIVKAVSWLTGGAA